MRQFVLVLDTEFEEVQDVVKEQGGSLGPWANAQYKTVDAALESGWRLLAPPTWQDGVGSRWWLVRES